MKEPKRRKLKAPGGNEIMELMAAALQAADEMGIDSLRIVREVLGPKDVSPKKENENP